MKIEKKILLFIVVIGLLSCATGHLDALFSLPNSLKEVSAAEIIEGDNTVWMIEDQGNAGEIFGYDLSTDKITRKLLVKNAKNEDWEDLTSDKEGNIYIGDFGNNSGKRKTARIYKLSNIKSEEELIEAEIIEYTVPEQIDKEDYESFFLYNGYFYIFTKNDKKGTLIKVPNIIGKVDAKIVTDFNLKGKDGAITSADISSDGKEVVLLNHDKLWILSEYEDDNFFSGKIALTSFEHNSQKEGICYYSNTKVIITDEMNGSEGGNIYSFRLPK